MHTPRVAIIVTSFVSVATVLAGCGEGTPANAAASNYAPNYMPTEYDDDVKPVAASNEVSAPKHAPAPKAFPDSPDKAIEHVMHSVAKGEMHVAWDALPASYQADITDLVHTFASKVDRDIWNRSFVVLQKLHNVLETKKSLILAMPNLQQSPDFDLNVAKREWNNVIAPLKTIAYSEFSNVDTLKHVDMRQAIGTTGATIVMQFDGLNKVSKKNPANKLSNLGDAVATLVSRDGDTAVVRIEIPGEVTKDQDFVKVEGKWIPADLASDWTEDIAEAREKLAQMSTDKVAEKKPQIMAIFDALDHTFGLLNAATTPEEFEQVLQVGVMQVFGGMMALGKDG